MELNTTSEFDTAVTILESNLLEDDVNEKFDFLGWSCVCRLRAD